MNDLDILNAFHKNEFLLHFQPQVDFEGKIIAVEGLVRWNHPRYGLLTSGDFLGVIAEKGLLNELNRWVTQNACNVLKRWESRNRLNLLSISINTSSFCSMKEVFFDDVKKIISSSEINPSKLRFEFSEQNFLTDLQIDQDRIKDMQEIGVAISLDHFSEKSPLITRLHEFSIQEIKISKILIDGIFINPKSLEMLKSILNQVGDLKIRILAQGIESYSQFDILQSLGFKYFQGNYFHKPKTLSEFESLYSPNDSTHFLNRCYENHRKHKQDHNFGLEFWKSSSISQIQDELEYLFGLEDLNFFFLQLESNFIVRKYFLYYCWLFSESPLLEKFLNRSDVPISYLYEIIFAGLSINESELNPVDYFSFWTNKISSTQSLRLLNDSNTFKAHPILIACLLSNLDAKTWEDFFSTLVSEESEIYNFLMLFKDFSLIEREKMFALNQTLTKYFNLLITLISSSYTDSFLLSLQQSINKTLKWEEYALSLRSTFQIEEEKNFPPKLRNSNRLSCIMHDTINLDSHERSIFLKYLYRNSVIVDEEELSLLEMVLEMQQNNEQSIFYF